VSAGASVGLGTVVERVSVGRLFAGGSSVMALGVVSFATSAGVAFGGGVAFATRASAARFFGGEGSATTAGVGAFARGAGVVLEVGGGVVFANRPSAVRVLAGEGVATSAGVVVLASGAGVVLAEGGGVVFASRPSGRVFGGETAAGSDFVGSGSAGLDSARRFSAGGVGAGAASTGGISGVRALIAWGLERKPTLGAVATFAGVDFGATASLGGTREFSHWSRFAASLAWLALWPSRAAPGQTNAEARTTARMNLPEGGKQKFKSMRRDSGKCRAGKGYSRVIHRIGLANSAPATPISACARSRQNTDPSESGRAASRTVAPAVEWRGFPGVVAAPRLTALESRAAPPQRQVGERKN